MDMNLSKLQEIMEERGAWCAAVRRAEKSRTRLSNWTTTTTSLEDVYLVKSRSPLSHILREGQTSFLHSFNRYLTSAMRQVPSTLCGYWRCEDSHGFIIQWFSISSFPPYREFTVMVLLKSAHHSALHCNLQWLALPFWGPASLLPCPLPHLYTPSEPPKQDRTLLSAGMHNSPTFAFLTFYLEFLTSHSPQNPSCPTSM